MAIAAEKGGRETLATTFVLDGDVHLNEPPGELAEYAESRWHVGLREIAKASGLSLADAIGWKLTWSHEGEIITCPWHGLEFHVPTGQCMAWPEIRLRTYDVTVVDGEIEAAL